MAYIKNTRRLLLPFVESGKYANARPPIKEYPEISDVFSKEILKALHDRMTVGEALESADTLVNDILK